MAGFILTFYISAFVLDMLTETSAVSLFLGYAHILQRLMNHAYNL